MGATFEHIMELIVENDLIIADGHDEAILGIVNDHSGLRVLYNSERLIDGLAKNNNMSWDDAEEYFEFNILGAYIGPNGPLFTAIIHN